MRERPESRWKIQRRIQRERNDALQMKIDSLSPMVKNYFSIGQALKGSGMTEDEVKMMKDTRLHLYKNFGEKEMEEIVDFVHFREQNNRDIRRGVR